MEYMEDMHASKAGKEEIIDGQGNSSHLNLEVEKLVEIHQSMGFQSSSASITQEPTGTEPYRVGTCEAHGKKHNKGPNKPLSCPRCQSLDTKFCYFNNYNINQPRHFCRKCQRYWTAGGVLRNVPMGAGRRRSKSYTTHQKHDEISDAKSSRCVTYSMAKSDAKVGGLHAQMGLASFDAGQLMSDDGLSASSIMLSFGQKEVEKKSSSLRMVNTEEACPKKHEEMGANLGLNCNFDDAKENGTSTSTWGGHPGAMWTHMPVFMVPPGPLSLDWAHAYWYMPSYLTAVASISSTPSQGMQADTKGEGSLLIPKMLRINNPIEAAQSSFWKALGLDRTSASSADIKEAFQPEAVMQNEKDLALSSSQH